MPFCSLLQRRRFLQPSDLGIDSYPQPLLMDLSSLEGPPINDPRVVIMADDQYMDGHIRLGTPGRDMNNDPSRLWRPLPPRPSSTEPTTTSTSTSTSHQYHSQAQNLRPINTRTETSLSEGQLRRAPAQRGRRTPSPDIDIDINLHMELSIEPRVSNMNERSRSPIRAPAPLFHMENPASGLHERNLNRRSRSCCPLVWVESEQRWVVIGSFPQQEESWREQSRTPMPLPGPSTSFDRIQIPESYGLLQDGDTTIEPADHPPTYESHGFSPTYVTRLGQGRWTSVAHRMHDLSSR